MSDLDSVPEIALPALDDRAGWAAHWQTQGQPWQIEPESAWNASATWRNDAE